MTVPPDNSRHGPLAGYRIADLTHWQAGPSATLLLSYLGAEVIKVESRSHLDRYRTMLTPAEPTAGEAHEWSPMFHEYNAGKLSVQLNLRTPEGVSLLKRLLGKCDAMVYNLRQATMDRLGLGCEQLLEANPALLILAISNSGASGPERDYYGYAPTFAALGGVAHLSGYPGMPPCEHTAWPDTVVGAWAAALLLAAIYAKEPSATGYLVDLSGREALTWYAGEALLAYRMIGDNGTRRGNEHPSMAPHNCYPCVGDDRWVSIAVGGETEWWALVEAMGAPQWATAPEFQSAEGRWAHRERLDELVAEWTSQRSDAEVVEALQLRGVPATPSFSNAQLYEDTHLHERAFFETVVHPLAGSQTMPGPPWRFSDTPARIVGSAPLLGQQNSYVLEELLNLDSAAIQRLVDQGAVS